MNRALRFTLLGLVVVILLFFVTWFRLPSNESVGLTFSDQISFPASLFDDGLDDGADVLFTDDLNALRTRVLVVYGSLVAIVIVVGLALGAAERGDSLSRAYWWAGFAVLIVGIAATFVFALQTTAAAAPAHKRRIRALARRPGTA
jgi:hypothetical protein